MEEKKKKKHRYKFTDKKHPVKAMISMMLGMIALISIIVTSYYSSLFHGKAGIIIAFVGMGAFLCSVVGFLMGLSSLKQKDIFHTIPISSILLNGMLLVIYFTLYLLGLSI